MINYQYILLGIIAGTISSIFGVGSGIVLIPALTILFEIGQKSAQGISLTVMIPIILVGATRYILNPSIEASIKLASIIAVGGIIGAFIGSKIAFMLPAVMLKRIFACFIIIAGLNILFKSFKSEKNKTIITHINNR